jgi:hypothetical protein
MMTSVRREPAGHARERRGLTHDSSNQARDSTRIVISTIASIPAIIVKVNLLHEQKREKLCAHRNDSRGYLQKRKTYQGIGYND